MRLLLLLLPPLFFTACQSEPTVDPLVGTTWAFATQNPVTTEPSREPMQLGDVLTVAADTVFFTSLKMQGMNGVPRYDAQRGGDTLAKSVRLSQPAEGVLNVDLLEKGQVTVNRYFTPEPTGRTPLVAKEVAGQTFRYQPAEGEATLVYFDVVVEGTRGNFLSNGFIVTVPTAFWNERTLLTPGGTFPDGSFGTFRPTPIDGPFAYVYIGKTLGLGNKAYRIFRTDAGEVEMETYSGTLEPHRVERVILEPVPGVVPSDVSPEEFGNRLTDGVQSMDREYPEIDSASVKYVAKESFAGRILSRDDLSELSFTFNQDGQFIFVAGDEVLTTGMWALSPDRNFLIITQEMASGMYLPILKYDEEEITFRYPMSVATREPRGVELGSYGIVNTFINVKRR
ncbi:hypothetical protein [Neolewinella antarctica]|uniref:Uncharacterized protein n=1 Tax=Neolewinella antarctica TaxID=442734 RepID=A0ABX0XB26_9BACT|nr:hypothetical protein [Neolewinella antarctica]NJC26407.1 hypothetical protein [Neolewinella antarctica]